MLTKLTAEEENALQDRHTAYHEAAHCVIGYRHGWTLTPEKGIQVGALPVCWMRFPSHDLTSFRQVHQALAGWIAETILTPERASLQAVSMARAYWSRVMG